jgi:hypothetical protein
MVERNRLRVVSITERQTGDKQFKFKGIISRLNTFPLLSLPLPLPLSSHPTFTPTQTISISFHAILTTTLHPNAPASLTAHPKHPLPLLEINAFHPLSAQTALANISKSDPRFPREGFSPLAISPLPPLRILLVSLPPSPATIGKCSIEESVQSITRTLGIVEDVVWVVESVR